MTSTPNALLIIGHDFGAVVAWGAPLLHPDRFAGVGRVERSAGAAAAGADHAGPPQGLADNFFYILYFQEPGPADAELSRDPATTLRRLMGSLSTADEAAALRMLQSGPEGFIDRIPEPGGLPDWISQGRVRPLRSRIHQDRLHRTAELVSVASTATGELTATTPAATISVPSLFIGGAADPTLAYTPRHRVRAVSPVTTAK